MMTNEELVEEIQLGHNIQGNMGELYLKNKNFIYQVAREFQSTKYELDDLMQEAYFGLFNAAKGFDPDQEVKFLTYAAYHIRKCIRRFYFSNISESYRIPEYIVILLGQYKKFCSDYKQKNQEEPSDQEIMDALEVSEEKLHQLQGYLEQMSTISMDALAPGKDGVRIGETIPDICNIEDQVIEAVTLLGIWEEVDKLEDRQKKIILGRYKEDLTQGDLATDLKISRAAIGQIEKEALKVLKNNKYVRHMAEVYGYDNGIAYKGSVGRFKNTGYSCVESLALKRIELEESKQSMDDVFSNILCSVAPGKRGD